MLQVQAIRICSWENCDQIRKAGTPTELTEIAFLNFERGKKKIGKREKCKTLTKHRECSIRKERIQFIFVSFAFALSFLLPLSVCAFDCFRLWFVGHPFETVFSLGADVESNTRTSFWSKWKQKWNENQFSRDTPQNWAQTFSIYFFSSLSRVVFYSTSQSHHRQTHRRKSKTSESN